MSHTFQSLESIAFIQNLSTPEIILFALVMLLFFGAKRLPGLFRSVGESVKEFKKGALSQELESAEPNLSSTSASPAQKQK
ncbi:MAG: twin-arginine translocase TatA/TatE family subunit [Puniceicoccaceae bacterium]|nr:twin-arginine translocase TatA/TatE family subunit [Puniceicoccaceae bacterium]